MRSTAAIRFFCTAIGEEKIASLPRGGEAIYVDSDPVIVRIGVNECTLYGSWGHPDKINRAVGAWGVNSQLVYPRYGAYVYIQNGIVRSFQY